MCPTVAASRRMRAPPYTIGSTERARLVRVLRPQCAGLRAYHHRSTSVPPPLVYYNIHVQRVHVSYAQRVATYGPAERSARVVSYARVLLYIDNRVLASSGRMLSAPPAAGSLSLHRHGVSCVKRPYASSGRTNLDFFSDFRPPISNGHCSAPRPARALKF